MNNEINEQELETVIQLNEDNRCIACDCLYLPTDKVVKLKRKDLPNDYLTFNRMLFDYKYVNGQFVLEKVEQPKDELTELKERQERTEQAVQDLILATMGV